MSAEDERLAAAVAEASGVRGLSLVRRMDQGMSGDIVLELAGEKRLFAKLGDPGRRVSTAELARETAALRWLNGRIGAPPVVWSGDVGSRPALLTEALAGVALHDLPPDQAEIGALAAIAALRDLHALPVTDCPFNERLAVKLAGAQARLDAGEVDEADFDAERAGRTAASVFSDLLARRPAAEDLVVTHGDACWPNFILRGDGTAGIIDLGRFGVADRYQDLALFLRSGAFNVPTLDLMTLVKAHYPIAELDEDRLAFFRLLDEFY